MVSKTNEQVLEAAIEKALTGTCFSRHIQAHPDFHLKVADNKDAQNRDLAFKKILDDVMGQQRKKELELYKLYAKEESFYQVLFDTMKRMIDNPKLGQYLQQ